MRNVLIFLCCIAAIAAVEGTRQLLRWSKERRDGELRRRLRAVVGAAEPGDGATLLRQRRFASSAAMDALLRDIPFAQRVEKLLEQADSRLTVAQFLLWTSVAAFTGVMLAAILGLGIVVALSLGLAGLVLPFAALVVARGRRSYRLSEQLPEALEMMSRSLRAGHALTSAFEVVATEMPEPISIEFARAFEAQRLGLPVEQAIVQMTERAPGNRDLKIFAVSAVIQRETGGNLAELLGNIAETVRARFRFYGKLRALTAEGRASGVILGCLPVAMAILLRIVNPKYVTPLVSTPSGHLILAFAILMWLGGIAWLVKLTQVDV